MPPTYTVPEIAKFFRISPKTVYTWIRNGDLPAFRFGRSIRVPVHSVIAFVQSGANEDAA